MRQVIEELAKEGFLEHRGSLSVDMPEILIELHRGERAEGTVRVSGGGQAIRGFVYTTHMRMRCEPEEFEGVQTALSYCFDAEGLEEGETVCGEIWLVSSAGELSLPFRARVVECAMESSVGEIKNLFHFTNLARDYWEEAVRLFYEPQFEQLVMEREEQYRQAYYMLAAGKQAESNVNEFLIATHKKERAEYRLERSGISVEGLTGDSSVEVVVRRKGWGYTRLIVQADGAFLLPEREVITDDDFLGNTCVLVIGISWERLHGGSNFGRIRLTGDDCSLVCEIDAMGEAQGSRREYRKQFEVRQLYLSIVRSYLQFRVGRQQNTSKIKEAVGLVERLTLMERSQPLPRLIQAHMLLANHRVNEAGWILSHVELMGKDGSEDGFLQGYYLYLYALKERSQAAADEAAAYARARYAADESDWRYLWLLLFLDEELNESPVKKLEAIIAQVERGCRSPLLYAEASNIYAAQPSLLHRLSDGGLRIVQWMMRHSLVGGQMLGQIVYLGSSVKGYDERLLHILEECFERRPEDETVAAICTLLMKGNRTDSRAFCWYAEGVARGLRIIRLYEYYMYAWPAESGELLPKTVRLYFVYNNRLEPHFKARLYRNLLEHEDEIPEMIRSYEEQMERFVMERILAEDMSADMAFLYRRLFTPALVGKDTAEHLYHMAFIHQVCVRDCRGFDGSRLIALHKKLNREQSAPLTDGVAFLPIYDGSVVFAVENERGERRIVPQGSFSTEEIFDREQLFSLLSERQPDVGMSLYLCRKERHYQVISESTVESFGILAMSGEVRQSYKKEIRCQLLHFYYQHDMMQELDLFLEKIAGEELAARERAEFIEYLILRDRTEEACHMLKRYGAERISNKTLVKLCTKMILELNYEESPLVTRLCHHALLGDKYNQITLTYLVRHLRGPIRQLRFLRKRAKAFEIDVSALDERLLEQMLFSGIYIEEKDEVFERYIIGGSRTLVEMAWLSQAAYAYFAGRQETDERIFTHLARNYEQGEVLNDICCLALLRHYAKAREDVRYPESVLSMLDALVRRLLDQGLYFEFFQHLGCRLPELMLYKNVTVVEYRSESGGGVRIHYRWEDGEDFRTEEMRRVAGCIYTKRFLLFFGEKLEYYVTGMQEEEGEHRAEDVLTVSSTGSSLNTRYDTINDIGVGIELQEKNMLLESMEAYYRRLSTVQAVFTVR